MKYKVKKILKVGKDYTAVFVKPKIPCKIGDKISDDKGNIFKVNGVGMIHYDKPPLVRDASDLLLIGNFESEIIIFPVKGSTLAM